MSAHIPIRHSAYLSSNQIAIDSAVFPEGTSGHQLDVLARRALWKDGLNYLVCNASFYYSINSSSPCISSMEPGMDLAHSSQFMKARTVSPVTFLLCPDMLSRMSLVSVCLIIHTGC